MKYVTLYFFPVSKEFTTSVYLKNWRVKLSRQICGIFEGNFPAIMNSDVSEMDNKKDLTGLTNL